MPLSHQHPHIAIIRLSAMGDVAMTVPVILALAAQHPKVKITVVSRPFFKPIFEHLPNVKFFSVHTQHEHKGLLGLYRLYQDLKAHHVTEIADLHNVLRSKVVRLLFALSGKKVAFTDKGRAEKKALTSLTNKKFQPLKTMVERHLDTFKKLGYSINLDAPYFLKQDTIPLKAIEILGEKHEKWIGIAPFAHYSGKTYPIDLMQKVIEELSNKEEVKILLFGGDSDLQRLETLVNGKSNVFNFAKKISFKEELHLISNLDVMLSMDSGNAHLAAIFGVKTITLWGATHPYAGFAPYNQPAENSLVADREHYPLLPTSVYGNKKVAGYEDAMRTIPVEKIVARVISQLED
ncbi:MAG: glycosyltransferase family 9 protein [Flavobacterium sp.]